MKLDFAVPLAARMRPQTLEDMVGQEHLLGPQGLLTRLVSKQHVPSLILWGPPGSGKTTLAEILCRVVKGDFIALSAVLAGVKEIREAIKKAQETKLAYQKQTYLFIDEIHRFNKSQQDALLPHVESGDVTLIGATTENPSFSVNTPLLSRCRVLVLKPLEPSHMEQLLARVPIPIDDTAKAKLILAASGDARILLSTLEIAADLAGNEPGACVTEKEVEMATGRRLIAHDRAGDSHYNVISAFIKSLRGSDPDAACYYLARLLEAGEDPRFILRRMVIFASEDVGNADPQAIQVAIAALQAYEFVGLPEGYLPLTHAATYLACAPKSGAVIAAYGKAKEDVEKHGSLPVPLHICNAPTGLMKQMGYGKGYLYAHDFEENHVTQDYLPDKIAQSKYYFPTQNGYERFIAERLEKWRNKKC